MASAGEVSAAVNASFEMACLAGETGEGTIGPVRRSEERGEGQKLAESQLRNGANLDAGQLG